MEPDANDRRPRAESGDHDSIYSVGTMVADAEDIGELRAELARRDVQRARWFTWWCRGYAAGYRARRQRRRQR
jgi:hypothetical protein